MHTVKLHSRLRRFLDRIQIKCSKDSMKDALTNLSESIYLVCYRMSKVHKGSPRRSLDLQKGSPKISY